MNTPFGGTSPFKVTELRVTEIPTYDWALAELEITVSPNPMKRAIRSEGMTGRIGVVWSWVPCP